MLLRAFPYTRNAGEALFALVFALALFYPFMFIFDYEVHKIMQYNIVNPEKAASNFIHKSGLMGVFGPALIVMFLMAGVFVPFFLGGALSVAFELVRTSVYYIVIVSVILPFLNIFVTLTVAREIAAFFKTDVNFMSFLKII
jgi:sterol desaturase/sphingolipid hydroxylase (fatty acid hydroxylase superfamily)